MTVDLIDAALEALRAQYVFPDTAERAARAIRSLRDRGAYDGIDEAELCERLTHDLYEICGDRHLRVRVRAVETRSARDPDEVLAGMIDGFVTSNFGIARVERLAGNVGYVDLHMVVDASLAGAAVGAAMELVSRTSALILDLRQCPGGSPNGVQLWVSQLVADDETPLDEITVDGVTRQYWTLAHVPGPRYLDRPVYVLTSATTFSGGEALCYDLQAIGRATLVGAPTGGGAHPTRYIPISDTVEITVPFARPVHPLTGGNWEGTGVIPDVEVPAEDALDTAYALALEAVIAAPTTPTSVVAEAEREAALRTSS